MIDQEFVVDYLRRHPGSTVGEIVTSLDPDRWDVGVLRRKAYSCCASLKKFRIIEGTEVDGVTRWQVVE